MKFMFGSFLLFLAIPIHAQDKPATLTQQKMCDDQASKVYHKGRTADGFHEEDTTGMNGYTSHLDTASNVCYVWIRYSKLDAKTVTFADTIYDAFEGRMYASYLWYNPGKPAVEVQPTNCFVHPRKQEQITCKSQEEFDSLVDKYFGIGR